MPEAGENPPLEDDVARDRQAWALTLNGTVDDPLVGFMDMIYGTDAIRYWDDSISDWADITDATCDDDYTLSYLTEGDLAGYTLLTVECTMGGDANGDGIADGLDLDIMGQNWKQSALLGDGDFSGDGYIDHIHIGGQFDKFNRWVIWDQAH